MSKKVGPAMPEGAENGGSINNGDIPTEARTPSKGRTRLDPGPKMGAQGEYLPATYRTLSGSIRTDN